MAWPLIVIRVRPRLAASSAEGATALRTAGLDRQLRVYPDVAAAMGPMGSR
jgi:hypothetical protein